MRIAFVHLSDIHIGRSANPILERTEPLAAAINAAAEGCDRVVIAVTGDIANTGSQDEYLHAHRFFTTLRTHVGRGNRAQVVMVPGNHDCDFTDEPALRKLSIKNVISDKKLIEDAGVQDICTSVQRNYFNFASETMNMGELRPALVHEFLVDGINFLLINSAWMSSLKEAPGTLAFPTGVIKAAKANELVVACIHHPFGWFEPDQARTLRKRLETIADVILTGHEHTPDGTILSSVAGATYSHFEGGVLQERGNAANSTFLVYVVESDTSTYERWEFRWNGEAYLAKGIRPEQPRPNKQVLPVNRLRGNELFRFSESHQRYLEELALNLHHRTAGSPKLSQLYVFPDLLQLTPSADLTTFDEANVRGDMVAARLLESKCSLVVGESESGRTSLAKAMCKEARDRGFVPVLIAGSKRLRTMATGIRELEKAVSAQYEGEVLQQFQQLAPSNRFVIVDDFHLISSDIHVLHDAAKWLSEYTPNVLLLGDDVVLDLAAALKPLPSAFTQYRVKPLGPALRNRIVSKWLSLSPDENVGEVIRKLNHLTRTLDDVLGRNYIPAYPVYVLVLMQASDTAVSLDVQSGSKGYYYEYLIKSELIRGGFQQKQLDVIFGFLSFVAGRFLGMTERSFDLDAFDEAKVEFERKYDLKLSNRNLLAALCDLKMLCMTSDRVAFKYPYVFYYFAARHISRTLDREDTRALVLRMCNELHANNNGDILLFVAHLSSDRFVVDAMLDAAKKTFERYRDVQKSPPLSVLQELDETSRLVFKEEDLSQTRERALQARDENEMQRTQPGSHDDPLAPMTQIASAMRTMEILGQVLKNNPGHLEGDRKLEIARECYLIGARAWRWTLELFESSKVDIVREIAEQVRKDAPGIDMLAFVREVRSLVTSLLQFAAFGLVKRIAHSIGSAELDTTYKKLAAEIEEDVPKLVRASILLDHSAHTPESVVTDYYSKVKPRPLSAWILRNLVYEHMHMYHLDVRTKQRLCAALDIEYQPALGLKARK